MRLLAKDHEYIRGNGPPLAAPGVQECGGTDGVAGIGPFFAKRLEFVVRLPFDKLPVRQALAKVGDGGAEGKGEAEEEPALWPVPEFFLVSSRLSPNPLISAAASKIFIRASIG